MGYLIIFGFPIMVLIVAVYTIIDTSIKHKNIDSGLEYYDIPVQARFNGVKCIFASGNYLYCRDYLVWTDSNNLIFLEDGYDRITNHWAKKIKIPIEQLEFYSISGSGHYISQNHFDEKNKISVGGAITGGLIAGVPGAILCGRKKIIESSTSTQYIDNHMTEMVLNENGNMTKYCFCGQDMYNILSSYVPHKEYGIYTLNQLNQQKKSL